MYVSITSFYFGEHANSECELSQVECSETRCRSGSALSRLRHAFTCIVFLGMPEQSGRFTSTTQTGHTVLLESFTFPLLDRQVRKNDTRPKRVKQRRLLLSTYSLSGDLPCESGVTKSEQVREVRVKKARQSSLFILCMTYDFSYEEICSRSLPLSNSK